MLQLTSEVPNVDLGRDDGISKWGSFLPRMAGRTEARYALPLAEFDLTGTPSISNKHPRGICQTKKEKPIAVYNSEILKY
jgi:hypothetical protein